MTADKLIEILSKMVRLDQELQIQSSLSQIRDALTNLTSSPGAAQQQNILATAMATFSNGAHQLRDQINPSECAAIDELGGSEFFDPGIADKVRDSVERNAMTPSVARDFVQDVASRRETFMERVRSSLDGLKMLLSGSASSRKTIGPGEAAFVIPREIFKNELGSFAKEVNFINQLVEHLSEAATGEVQTVELQSLSSSNPMIAIAAGLGVLKLLGTVINSFLDAWAKIQKMRKVAEDVKELGLSKTASKEMEETILTTVEEVVEQSTRMSLENFSADGSRRNELKNGLRRDIRRLYGQIEIGLTVEIRAHDGKAPSDDESKKDLAALAELAKNMHFPVVSKQPILLTSGEILEGEITRTKTVVKKATTEKTARERVQQE